MIREKEQGRVIRSAARRTPLGVVLALLLFSVVAIELAGPPGSGG